MSELTINEVTNIDDALDIAFVRNSGATYLTGNPNSINADKQIEWYYEIYQPARLFNNLVAFIGRDDKQNPVAYGLVSRRDEDYWVTGVIEESQRGKGYGEQLFRYLSGFVLSTLADRVMLDVLPTNERAIKLYEKLGYVAVFHEDNRIVMVLDKESWGEPQPTNI